MCVCVDGLIEVDEAGFGWQKLRHTPLYLISSLKNTAPLDNKVYNVCIYICV